MRTAVSYILALLLLTLAACDSDSAVSYVLDGSLADSLGVDSVTLSIVRDDYGKSQTLAAAGVKNGRFLIEGQIDCNRIACLTFAGKDDRFYFILGPGKTSVEIGGSKLVISGVNANYEYFSFLSERLAIEEAIAANRVRYEKQCADSTLTAESEKKMAQRDSVLNDSLQRFTLHRIQRGDLPSRIVRHRYYTSLDSLHQHELLHPTKPKSRKR